MEMNPVKTGVVPMCERVPAETLKLDLETQALKVSSGDLNI